ncbi:ROK family protein [Thermocoleostomius sinensis]|jgi:polyphosphate glucokinase|uniref:ROK family protein n=1 Tax=Thermocoleostomius sinensis A174 TaxID=2016057 RepID=A0A9E9C9T4_9CYAN|nr:ROK family protein [Thermocoleostomius sinensis]WAL58070.1 ROK family protein [Thermocoleostomius sinensis A174]
MMAAETQVNQLQTLAVDIGGSGVKVMVLDQQGNPLSERDRLDTPTPATPEAILLTLDQLIADKTFDRISVGFPGVVRFGVVETAANLDPSWIGFNLAAALAERFGKPVRAANDADIQGLGVVNGHGVELVVTLGTGFGSALFVNGRLVPNLELAHHAFRKNETYEQQLGRATLDRIGKKRWSRRLLKAIDSLSQLFNYDRLYLGGGNAKKLEVELPSNVQIVPNVAGLLGGISLWRD